MTNTLNNQNIDNSISTKSISRYSEAPKVIPKFSIHKMLQEKDEFRKSVRFEQKEIMKSKQNKGILENILAIGGFIAAITVLHIKKII